MKYLLLFLLCSSTYAAKFIHVYQGQIVQKYLADQPIKFGGPWAEGVAYDVGSLDLAKVKYEDGEFFEDNTMSEEEIAVERDKF